VAPRARPGILSRRFTSSQIRLDVIALPDSFRVGPLPARNGGRLPGVAGDARRIDISQYKALQVLPNRDLPALATFVLERRHVAPRRPGSRPAAAGPPPRPDRTRTPASPGSPDPARPLRGRHLLPPAASGPGRSWERKPDANSLRSGETAENHGETKKPGRDWFARTETGT